MPLFQQNEVVDTKITRQRGSNAVVPASGNGGGVGGLDGSTRGSIPRLSDGTSI
ncbi:uncharacterized protein BT62DRAFT_933260 [Guyanagaster necrorhizus]|uniref:Uncharacterized protein n=1 Tax=Guyanagaster necrorhizus TaxID=856835 RepID=A0A9P8AT17_9AGAR|nr:uncharacterized protein BT62DRAFT_933260 [Guyanagaster necrorhizus MCA 3950]KAG7445432.1 hypothetical protein BT62DRAFT_933260 [Guyanagaster necrorhizus MCA 3950]